MLRGHLLDDVRLELWHLGNLQHLLGAVLGVNGLQFSVSCLQHRCSQLADSGEELDMSVETVVLQAPAPNTGKGTTWRKSKEREVE